MATIIYDEPWSPSDINCEWKPEKLSRYSFVNGEKDMTPLDIVDNKEGVQIYQDLHFEVYVKAEAIIKNFVDCFNLKSFQNFIPNDSNNFKFCTYTPNYYDLSEWDNTFIPNHWYSFGDKIKQTNVPVYGTLYYYCLIPHTSSSSFVFDNKWWTYRENLDIFSKDKDWLSIIKNISEDNYNLKDNYPYVAELVFKNLWGNDLTNYLKTYVKHSNFCIYYDTFFREHLRLFSPLFDKFFDQGYFENPISSVSEISGVRFIFGESFKSDEILGNNKLNNYLSITEVKKILSSSSYDPSIDEDNIEYFGGNILNPYDHYYKIEPNSNIPFFKEKVFEDCYIELCLVKKDILGNIIKRIVDLPILLTFTNNLIKIFTRAVMGKGFYDDGINSCWDNFLLNSDNINIINIQPDFEGFVEVVVWCPNIERLNISFTLNGRGKYLESPTLKGFPYSTTNFEGGQLATLKWQYDTTEAIGELTTIFKMEYNDGSNYDNFIFQIVSLV